MNGIPWHALNLIKFVLFWEYQAILDVHEDTLGLLRLGFRKSLDYQEKQWWFGHVRTYVDWNLMAYNFLTHMKQNVSWYFPQLLLWTFGRYQLLASEAEGVRWFQGSQRCPHQLNQLMFKLSIWGWYKHPSDSCDVSFGLLYWYDPLRFAAWTPPQIQASGTPLRGSMPQ